MMNILKNKEVSLRGVEGVKVQKTLTKAMYWISCDFAAIFGKEIFHLGREISHTLCMLTRCRPIKQNRSPELGLFNPVKIID